MKSVVGSKGTTMPMRPIPTSTSPSSSQTVRTARPRCTRPPGEGSAKTRIDMRLHACEGRDRTIDHTALLSLIKCYAVERGDDGAPVRRRACRRGGQMPSAVVVRQTDLRRFLAEERRAHVGALGDIEPAQRGGDIDHITRHENRSHRLWRLSYQLRQIRRDQMKSLTPAETGRQGVQACLPIPGRDAQATAVPNRED